MPWRAAAAFLSGVVPLVLWVQNVPADDFLSPAMQPDDLLEQLGRPNAPRIVDLRAPVEFRIAHLPGAVNIPLAELGQRLEELRPDPATDVLIYCLNGSRTRKAESLLYENDIDKIYHLEGSLEQWLKHDYPVEKGGPGPAGWH
jgi:rhodanese-related sulfurtransferase